MTSTDLTIARGLAELVHVSGTNSRDHGFHDDWPVDIDLINPGQDRDLQRSIAEKIALIHEEVSEMLGEIRDGRDPLEIYFVDKKGIIGPKGQEYEQQHYNADGVPQLKPEGFLVEMADMFIRGGDLTFLVGGSDKLIEAREIKHEYNATRPYKHGRKF